MLGVIAATILATACQYGSWADEVVKIDALRNAACEYRLLTADEQKKVVEQYYAESHERIDWPHAWIERSIQTGIVDYSVIFVDDKGCIEFRLNVTGQTVQPKRPSL